MAGTATAVAPVAVAARPSVRGRTALVRMLAGVLTFGLLLLTGTPAHAIENTWSARAADVPGAAEVAHAGKGVTVAVLDSWVDSRHPDFRGHVLPGATCTKGDCRNGGTDVPDGCEAHGTHVSGLVGSSRFGVAPDATILPVRVLLDTNGACQAQAADVASGVRWAATHGAQIINISLGSTYELTDGAKAIPRAVADASHRGVIVVVAAGNGRTPGVDVYGNDALVVAATGPDGKLASYSQRGTGVDLAAPGGQPKGESCSPDDCVVSTWSDRSYAADAGTSMAAPIVAGAAALLLSQKPDRGRDDVVSALVRTARPLAGAGAGTVDVLAAVRGKPATGRGGTDSVTAPGAAPSSSATPADSGTPPVAKVVGRPGDPTTRSPRSTLVAGIPRPDTTQLLVACGVALALLVVVALVVSNRAQRLVADADPVVERDALTDEDDLDPAADEDGFDEYDDDEPRDSSVRHR